MQPAPSQQLPRNGKQAEDPIDPYELVRRLSAVQVEEARKELERKRTNWETELLESRGEQHGQGRTHQVRAQAAPSVQHYRVHKRSASISLAPNQIPPPAYTDLPVAPRKQSLPLVNRQQLMASSSSSRRPSLKRGDSGLDLETINEDAVVEPSLENLFPEWSMAEKQRKRSSMLRSVSENSATQVVSTQPMSSRRSSLLPQGETGRRDWLQTDGQPYSRRQSALTAQRRHSRQDWTQSDESPRRESRRRSSLLDKLGDYLKDQGDQNSEASDSDAFDSRASTLRNSWRSSMGGSTSSRRASILKKVGDFWVGKPMLSEDEAGVQDIHVDEEYSGLKSNAAKRVSGLLSKLKL
ncbi:unnamed protein product [Discula destructiva]